MTADLEAAPPQPALLASVALISAAVLGFEIALTRVFAVLLWYHFAFLVISVALCGLGVGGYAAHWLRRRRRLSLPWLAALFGVTLDVAMVAMLRGVFPHAPEAYWVASLLVLVPFALAGAFLAEVFVRHPGWSGRLYASDLAGAAVASLGVVLLLQWMGAIDACLAIAVVGAAAGLCARTAGCGMPWRLLALVGALLLTWGSNRAWRWLDVPPMPPKFDAEQRSLADKGVTPLLFTDLGTPGSATRIIDTRWNAFARTDVVTDPDAADAYVIYTNGNVPSIMLRWDGKRETIAPRVASFPLSGWSFDVAPLGGNGGRGGRVFSIGPGGGLDALLALQHGAERFDGAEINPSIVALMSEPAYRAVNGGLYDHPDVHVVTAEGRAFAREAVAAGRSYELIFLALTKTAAAGQGMAMVEAFIYTRNAFEDYYRLLAPGGQLTIVVDEAVLLSRFLMTGLSVLRAHGIGERDAMGHVALMHDRNPGPYMFSFVMQKSPLTPAQTEAMASGAARRNLVPIWIPGRAAWREFLPCPDLADGTLSIEQFVAATGAQTQRRLGAGYDISPCSDDSPFVLDVFARIDPIFEQMAWFAGLLAIGVVALGWRGARRDARADVATPGGARLADVAHVAYFLALGVGFLLVEIPLTQKLILPLGYPTLALTVILFSLLMGGGAGAFVSQRFDGARLRRCAAASAFAVALAAATAAATLDSLSDRMLTMSLAARCAVAIGLLLPLGFLLGTPFPSGLRLFAVRREEQVPLMWGLNGVASVVGSLCAAIGAKAVGFNAMLLVGASAYACASGLLLAAGFLERSAAPGRGRNRRPDGSER